MLHRMKQLYRALTAEVRIEENEFINIHLTNEEQNLFYQMSVVDQRHALDVTYHALKALQARKKTGHDRHLVKAALLHDIGKLNGELTLLDRILIVILESFMPERMRQWAREGRGKFMQNRYHALYVAIHHGPRGAKFLQEIGSAGEVIQLVRDHHQPGLDDWRMIILQEADKKS